jgi:hypothetical protein
MLPRDFEGNTDADAKAFQAALKAWTGTQIVLRDAQARARTELDGAAARLGVLLGWFRQLGPLINALTLRRLAYDACVADLRSIDPALGVVENFIADRTQAYAVATSRLLGDVPTGLPIVLLPLRIETRWGAEELQVRLFADDVGINTHDELITAAEQSAGLRYWQAVEESAAGDAGAAQRLQAWEDLTRQVGAPRAAWVARVTDVATPGPATTPKSSWDVPLSAPLLPDRFAVMAIRDQTLRATGSTAEPRFVTWGAPIPPKLSYDVLAKPGNTSWLTDFQTAESRGMAVKVPISPGDAPIETLLVVGIRGESTPDLTGLLTGHSYTGGVELLDDGVLTNNSSDRRAAHSRDSRSDAARALMTDQPAPETGTAGAQLALLLGIEPGELGAWLGADRSRGGVQAAMARLVGAGVSGALRDSLGSSGQAWSVVSATGPAPTLRVGRQPYGVLPSTALDQWVPLPGEVGGVLAGAMHAWGQAVGPRLLLDPADPPNPPGISMAQAGDAAQQGALKELLVELPQSAIWSSAETVYAGVDLLVGPASGPNAPSVYLEQISSTDPAGLPALADALPSLLAKITIAAKQNAANAQDRADVDSALRELSTMVAPTSNDDRRAALATLLSATLDATSHRFDAWITGAVTERLLALRSQSTQTRVGAFGWLTRLEPSEFTRSGGHVLAPSLAHAATAAVLRAGYLAQTETAGQSDGSRQPMAVDLSSSRVRVAISILAAVRAGQPLAAVLGRQFEEDLVAVQKPQLQQYLAAFRKLTRFRTGSKLEHLEDDRAAAATALAETRRHLVALQADVVPAEATATTAATALSEIRQEQALAEAAAAKYVAAEQRITRLETVEIPNKTRELETIVARRPISKQHKHTIQVPDTSG